MRTQEQALARCPPRWQWEGASWVCLSSDHTDPTQPGWAGQTLGWRSSCLHPATRLAPATQTPRRFSGYQAEPEKLSRGLVDSSQNPRLQREARHPSPLQGQLSVQAALAFSQAFTELLLCARPCARLCLTQFLPQEHGELTQSFITDWTTQPSKGSVFSPPPGYPCPVL